MTTPTPAKGQRVQGAERAALREKAAALYMQGCTIDSVARQISRSYGAARELLLEAGVTLRRPGGH